MRGTITGARERKEIPEPSTTVGAVKIKRVGLRGRGVAELRVRVLARRVP